MPSLESYESTINAYASFLIPRDDGSITVTALAPVGSITVQGIVLTAMAGARITGANPTFNSGLGSVGAIAQSIQDAINDPANPFLALGVVAKSEFPVGTLGSVVALRRTNPAIAIVDSCTNITVLQAVIGDLAAGALTRAVPACHPETFAAQVIRWCRAAAVSRVYWNYSDAVPEGLIDPGFECHVVEDDALILFNELDAQAENYLGPGATFADLPIGPVYPPAAATQDEVVSKLLSGTLPILGGSGLNSLQMQTIARVPYVMAAIKAAYYLNYPMHVVWGANNLGVGPSGTGTGEPVFYDDPADETSNPNNRAVAYGAFNYRKWPYPIRQAVADRLATAMLEVNVDAAAANTEFAALTAEWANKTLINAG